MAVPVADLPRGQRRARRRRTAGASRCRPTPRSRSGCSRSSGPRFPDRLRAFMLTVVVVDDIVALIVIATVYTAAIVARRRCSIGGRALRASCSPSRAAASAAALVYARARGRARGSRCSKSGVDPVVVGLAMGLLTYASPAARADLERATDLFRLFREQPTPELARSARIGLQRGDLAERAAAAAVPPVDELRDRAAVRARERRHRDRRRASSSQRLRLADHARDPASATSSASRSAIAGGVVARDEAEPRPAAAAGRLGGASPAAALIAGIGFTVSLLIADLAFHGEQLERGEARRARAPALVASVADLARSSARRALLPHAAADPRAARDRRGDRSTSPCRSTPSATTSAAPRRRR